MRLEYVRFVKRIFEGVWGVIFCVIIRIIRKLVIIVKGEYIVLMVVVMRFEVWWVINFLFVGFGRMKYLFNDILYKRICYDVFF